MVTRHLQPVQALHLAVERESPFLYFAIQEIYRKLFSGRSVTWQHKCHIFYLQKHLTFQKCQLNHTSSMNYHLIFIHLRTVVHHIPNNVQRIETINIKETDSCLSVAYGLIQERGQMGWLGAVACE